MDIETVDETTLYAEEENSEDLLTELPSLEMAFSEENETALEIETIQFEENDYAGLEVQKLLTVENSFTDYSEIINSLEANFSGQKLHMKYPPSESTNSRLDLESGELVVKHLTTGEDISVRELLKSSGQEDHLVEYENRVRQIQEQGFAIAEQQGGNPNEQEILVYVLDNQNTVVTFALSREIKKTESDLPLVPQPEIHQLGTSDELELQPIRFNIYEDETNFNLQPQPLHPSEDSVQIFDVNLDEYFSFDKNEKVFDNEVLHAPLTASAAEANANTDVGRIAFDVLKASTTQLGIELSESPQTILSLGTNNFERANTLSQRAAYEATEKSLRVPESELIGSLQSPTMHELSIQRYDHKQDIGLNESVAAAVPEQQSVRLQNQVREVISDHEVIHAQRVNEVQTKPNIFPKLEIKLTQEQAGDSVVIETTIPAKTMTEFKATPGVLQPKESVTPFLVEPEIIRFYQEPALIARESSIINVAGPQQDINQKISYEINRESEVVQPVPTLSEVRPFVVIPRQVPNRGSDRPLLAPKSEISAAQYQEDIPQTPRNDSASPKYSNLTKFEPKLTRIETTKPTKNDQDHITSTYSKNLHQSETLQQKNSDQKIIASESIADRVQHINRQATTASKQTKNVSIASKPMLLYKNNAQTRQVFKVSRSHTEPVPHEQQHEMAPNKQPRNTTITLQKQHANPKIYGENLSTAAQQFKSDPEIEVSKAPGEITKPETQVTLTKHPLYSTLYRKNMVIPFENQKGQGSEDKTGVTVVRVATVGTNRAVEARVAGPTASVVAASNQKSSNQAGNNSNVAVPNPVQNLPLAA